MSHSHKIAIAAAALALAAPGLAAADTYTLANFSGGIFGGNANAQPPFDLAGITQGMPLAGSFLIDNDIAPGAGFDNIQYSSYPDAATIPPSVAFNFNIGSLNFTAAQDTGLAATQYNNGAFNGFAYSDDFTFQSVGYNLTISGGTFSIVLQTNPGQQFVSGFINIGDGAVTGQSPYTPPPPTNGGGGCDVNGVAACPGGPGVPEPGAWALMILGFGGVGAALRQRRRSALAAGGRA